MTLWLNLRKHSMVIAIVVLYIVADMILTRRELYFLNLLPFVLILIYLALARIDLVYFLIILFTPVSVQFIEFFPSSQVDFAIPTEPMLAGVVMLLLFRSVQHGWYNSRILNHPVTCAILFYLFWMLITTVTSTMPMVSVKYLLARIWFIVVYYSPTWSSESDHYIGTYIWCYTIPLLAVIAYSVYRHVGFGLSDKEAAHFVMNPFFRDHTSYGAILAMIFFGAGGLVLNREAGFLKRSLLWCIWLLLGMALILSYTRAAWISVL
jgi:hypothetical protein